MGFNTEPLKTVSHDLIRYTDKCQNDKYQNDKHQNDKHQNDKCESDKRQKQQTSEQFYPTVERQSSEATNIKTNVGCDKNVRIGKHGTISPSKDIGSDKHQNNFTLERHAWKKSIQT